MNNTHCCFTGHRPEKLPFSAYGETYARLCRHLDAAIQQKIDVGCRTFYTGMARGVDLLAAQAVLHKRQAHPNLNLRLVAVCPYTQGRTDAAFYEICAAADEVVTLHRKYVRGCLHQRNQYMVERCGHIIAVYDGYSPGGTRHTLALARQHGLEICQINCRDFL